MKREFIIVAVLCCAAIFVGCNKDDGPKMVEIEIPYVFSPRDANFIMLEDVKTRFVNTDNVIAEKLTLIVDDEKLEAG